MNIMDGYSKTTDMKNSDQDNMHKYMYMQQLHKNQQKIDIDIENISKELQKLPDMPYSMDGWISSFQSNFKLSDFTKIFNLNKRYKNLLEDRKSNGSKIKIFAIENLIDQINEVVKDNG